MTHPVGEERRIDVGGHKLHCTLRGAGEPSFVCLHGLVDTVSIWDELGALLTQRGQVVCIDQRGHGSSDAPAGPYTRGELAADVVGVLDALGLRNAVLVGHSMGGIIAMTAALAYPKRVRALVLIGTASQCSERVAAWYRRRPER